jgi:hypothetical protein
MNNLGATMAMCTAILVVAVSAALAMHALFGVQMPW